MKLLTKEIESKLPKLYSTDGQSVVPVIVKFFDPTGSWTWYAIEGEKHEDADGGWLFFGMVDGFEKELGYFTLDELMHAKDQCRGLKSLPIERDMHFDGFVLDKKNMEVRRIPSANQPAV